MQFVGHRFWVGFALVVTLVSPASADDTSDRVKKALPELDRFAAQILQKTGVPGMAIAVVSRDEVVHLQGYGLREAGKDGRVDSDTVFPLASVSKPIAATVLASLVGEKVIGWDDRVIDHDPGFLLHDPFVTREVTLRDLLCHRSGLPDHAGDLLEDLGYDRAEVLRRLPFVSGSSGFRAQFSYTNFGFTEAAVAGARAAGSTWEDLAAARLFQPLGMKSTSYRFADYAAAPNRVHSHVNDGGKWLPRFTRQADAQSPAGGASSSARDLAQWLRLLLAGGKLGGKPIIDALALAETHRPQIVSHPPGNPATDRAGFYGLGWNVNYDATGRVRLGHSGAFSLGAATAVTLLSSEGLGIVVVTNAAPIGVPEAVCASFVDLVLDGKIEADWLGRYAPLFAAMAKPEYGTETDYARPVEPKSPPLANVAYLGTYGNTFYGDLVVVEQNGSLQMRLGPKKDLVPLRHWDRDVFIYEPSGENSGGPSAVTFLIGPDRKADRVVVENLDVQGGGTFTRPTKPD